MREPELGRNLIRVRRLRMWTQGRLAEEAGVSPTTVSGLERGRISRPHFGTLRKLAEALGVDAEELISAFEPETARRRNLPEPLSFEWAMTVPEGEFEKEVEAAPLKTLDDLARALDAERRRLQRLYGELPRGSEQQRFVKRRIRAVAARSGSITTSIMHHPGADRQSVSREPGF